MDSRTYIPIDTAPIKMNGHVKPLETNLQDIP